MKKNFRQKLAKMAARTNYIFEVISYSNDDIWVEVLKILANGKIEIDREERIPKSFLSEVHDVTINDNVIHLSNLKLILKLYEIADKETEGSGDFRITYAPENNTWHVFSSNFEIAYYDAVAM